MQQTDISICIQPAGRRRRGYPFRLLTAFAATFPKGSVLTLSVKACRLCQLPLGGSLWRDRILCSSTGRCRRFEMASACALAIFSGKIIFISRLSRSAERSKRIFTGGVVTGNSICSTAFCESTALRASACSPGGSCRVATEGLLIGGAGKNG